MTMLFFSLVLLSIIYLSYYYFTRTFSYWKNRNVAGPTPVPLYGNLKESTLRRTHISSVMKNIYEQFPQEKVVGIYRMTTPCLLLRDLDVIKNVLIKDFDNFIDRGVEFSKEGLGANLFHSDGETWKALRNRFSPIFTTSKLKDMTYLLTERADKFLEYVQSVSEEKQEQEVHTLVQQYTIAAIAAVGFGLDADKFSSATKALLRRIDALIFDLNYAYEFDMMFPGLLKKLNKSLYPAEASDFFYNLVRTVFSQRDGKPSGRKDFMDLILEMRQQGNIQGAQKYESSEKVTVELTEGIIAAQAFSFYAAGYETSATALAFLLYQLAINPTIQDNVIHEIDAVLKKCNGELTYDVINEMTYLEKVFDETLRMYPVVDTLQRNAKADYIIAGTNITIAKGQTVMIPLLGIHYDEKYYPKPEVFDPERFSAQQAGERHPCAYLPFGNGPRNCVGKLFVLFSHKI